MSHSAAAEHEGAGAPPFADILCGVDGSRGSKEAARQAIALGTPGAELHFVAISHEAGVGLAASAGLSEARAEKSLNEAAHLAREAGLSASTELRKDGSVADALMAEGPRHDLLVLGSHGASRAGGIVLGDTASQAAHRTDKPLLIARGKAEAGDFPKAVLLASNGSPGSWAAARVTARIARARGSAVTVVHAPDGRHPEWTRQISKQIAEIEAATGVEPALVDGPGNAPDRIVAAATHASSSLIVIGRRGLTGMKALGSVSERVVHRAPCSTLVVPAE